MPLCLRPCSRLSFSDSRASPPRQSLPFRQLLPATLPPLPSGNFCPSGTSRPASTSDSKSALGPLRERNRLPNAYQDRQYQTLHSGLKNTPTAIIILTNFYQRFIFYH